MKEGVDSNYALIKTSASNLVPSGFFRYKRKAKRGSGTLQTRD